MMPAHLIRYPLPARGGAKALAAALSRPCPWVVERGIARPPSPHRALRATREGFQPIAAVSVSTRTALRLPVARIAVASLAHRLPRAAASRLTFALHEATANAAVHGNLGVPSAAGAGLAAIAMFRAAIGTALADRHRAGRAITIAIGRARGMSALAVADQGRGFRAHHMRGDAHLSGRGLKVMRANARMMHRTRGGRSVHLVFGAP